MLWLDGQLPEPEHCEASLRFLAGGPALWLGWSPPKLPAFICVLCPPPRPSQSLSRAFVLLLWAPPSLTHLVLGVMAWLGLLPCYLQHGLPWATCWVKWVPFGLCWASWTPRPVPPRGSQGLVAIFVCCLLVLLTVSQKRSSHPRTAVSGPQTLCPGAWRMHLRLALACLILQGAVCSPETLLHLRSR